MTAAFHPPPPICEHCGGLLEGTPPGPLGCTPCGSSYMLVEDEDGVARLHITPQGGLGLDLGEILDAAIRRIEGQTEAVEDDEDLEEEGQDKQ